MPVSDELSETIADIMTLTYEDFVEGRIESARESGYYKGLEAGEVRAYASTVTNLMIEMGVSVDEALKVLHIPDEYHESVKESLNHGSDQ